MMVRQVSHQEYSQHLSVFLALLAKAPILVPHDLMLGVNLQKLQQLFPSNNLKISA